MCWSLQKKCPGRKNKLTLAQKGIIALPNPVAGKKNPTQNPKQPLQKACTYRSQKTSKSMKFGQHIKATETFYENLKLKILKTGVSQWRRVGTQEKNKNWKVHIYLL